MKNRDRDQHEGRHEMGRHARDTYNPEPRWLQQDRESRRWTSQRDDESDDNIGGSQYGGSQYAGNEYGYGGSGRGSYAGSGREWGENTQGYGRQGAGTNRDFGGRDYGERDRSRMREEREYQQRTYGGGGRSTYSGYGAQSRSGAQDYSSGYESASYEDDDFSDSQRRYEPFRVGTGMGLGSTGGRGDYGREREFGQSYGGASGYGSRSGWDLGTHQRDTGMGSGTSRPSFRGMGPSHYKRSDDRIRDDIYERLTDSHVIDARSIMVDVNEGNVTLTGTVGERRMRYAAEDLVERIGGVANINNQLRVQQGEETRASSQPSTERSQQETKRH